MFHYTKDTVTLTEKIFGSDTHKNTQSVIVYLIVLNTLLMYTLFS